jgi:hypothetical protein
MLFCEKRKRKKKARVKREKGEKNAVLFTIVILDPN